MLLAKNVLKISWDRLCHKCLPLVEVCINTFDALSLNACFITAVRNCSSSMTHTHAHARTCIIIIIVIIVIILWDMFLVFIR